MFLISLLILAGSAYSLPSFSAAPRVREAATALEYVRELYYEMYDENGTARKMDSASGLPADVWCFSDRGVVEQKFPKEPATQSCSSFTQHVFEWPSLTKVLSRKPLLLESLYLRAYLFVDERTIQEGEKISLTLSVTLTSTDIHEMDTVETTQEITLHESSPDQWVEMDLTEVARKFWPQVKQSLGIKVTVEAQPADCHGLTQPPVHFFNPTSDPAEEGEEEERGEANGALQPLLLLFADNDLNSTHKRSQAPPRTDRGKRSTDGDCSKHDHIITFSEIGLTDVWIPNSLNIGKCSGSCSESTLRAQTHLGSNHARVMSSIRYIQDNAPSHGLRITTDGKATTPCCAPASFSPDTALVVWEEGSTLGIRNDYYKDLVVQSCSCQ